MGRAIDGAIWTQRRQWIGKQKASGLSVARFCRANGLSEANFYAWKRKLTGDKLRRSTAGGKVLSQAVRKNGLFVQVPIPTQETPTARQWVEVSNSDGIVIRVPAGNLAALKVVLAALGPQEVPTHA